VKLGVYTADQIKAARQADLPAWLQAHGYNLKKEGQNWRVPGYSGLIVQGAFLGKVARGRGCYKTSNPAVGGSNPSWDVIDSKPSRDLEGFNIRQSTATV
jgi:hypothetical protein